MPEINKLKLYLIILGFLAFFIIEIRGERSSEESAEDGGKCRKYDSDYTCRVLRFLCKKGGAFCGVYREKCKCKKGPPSQLAICLNECKPKCDGLDVSCELNSKELIDYCEKCIPPCIDLGVEIGIISVAPPFWDTPSYCEWCTSSCYSGEPNCFQSYCANCTTDCSGTLTTVSTSTSTTPDAELQECWDVCYPQCNNRDMSCQSNWTRYCYECAPRCRDKGVEVYYLFSDPPFGDEAAMCDWCFNQCFVENPSCIHGGCGLCDRDCRTKTTPTTDTTTITSTPDPELQNCFEFCYPRCNGRDLNCQSSYTSYCEECAPRCRDLGIEVDYFHSDPPFDEPGFCNWCEAQCYGRNPDCNHVWCGSCNPDCAKSTTTTISTTTIDSELQECYDVCYSNCNDRDMSCRSEWNDICYECVPRCQEKGVEVYYRYSDPPFEPVEFCNWCNSNCKGQNPSCNHVACDSCDPNCSITTTSEVITTTTPDAEVQECWDVCYPQCNNRDMSCQSDLNNYCYECAPRCRDKGVEVYYLFSDPPFGDEAAMCDWCFNQCFVENPSCIHGGCWMCDRDCRTKTTTTPTTTFDSELQECYDYCYTNCNDRDMSCRNEWNDICNECVPRCQNKGVPVYLLYSDPSFEPVEFCNWCNSQCFGQNPSCDHFACDSCDRNCSATTPTSSPTTTNLPSTTTTAV